MTDKKSLSGAREPGNPRGKRFYVVNAITLYRLVVAPVLIVLVFSGYEKLFSWLLPVSFFTDLIDGTIARRWKVASVFGSKMDSVADDLTILAGIVAIFVLKPWFIKENLVLVWIMIVLLALQNVMALIRYRKLSSFHTYAAKVAAILQGTFLILFFLLPEPIYPLFYAAAFVSIFDLSEEIILVVMLKEWKTDVKGVYWVNKDRNLPSPEKEAQRRSDGTGMI